MSKPKLSLVKTEESFSWHRFFESMQPPRWQELMGQAEQPQIQPIEDLIDVLHFNDITHIDQMVGMNFVEIEQMTNFNQEHLFKLQLAQEIQRRLYWRVQKFKFEVTGKVDGQQFMKSVQDTCKEFEVRGVINNPATGKCTGILVGSQNGCKQVLWAMFNKVKNTTNIGKQLIDKECGDLRNSMFNINQRNLTHGQRVQQYKDDEFKDFKIMLNREIFKTHASNYIQPSTDDIQSREVKNRNNEQVKLK